MGSAMPDMCKQLFPDVVTRPRPAVITERLNDIQTYRYLGGFRGYAGCPRICNPDYLATLIRLAVYFLFVSSGLNQGRLNTQGKKKMKRNLASTGRVN